MAAIPASPARYDLPPLARLETNWSPPWLIARVAQHGPMHYMSGEPMDDCHVVGGTSGCVWIAAADGVGSMVNSRHGARAACLAVDAFLGAKLAAGVAPSRELLALAFQQAHIAIQNLARSKAHPPRSYSTTLALALLTDQTIIAAVVGDSGIAVATEHEDENGNPSYSLTPFCSAPQAGNGTYTIADPNWVSYIATSQSTSPHITTVVVATDGANNYFLAPQGFAGHAFKPDWPTAIQAHLRELRPLTFVNTFASFIQRQPPENQDDRTLVVAYRPPEDLAPPTQKPR